VTGLGSGAEQTAHHVDVPGDLLAFAPSDPTAAGWQLADLSCR